MYRPKILKRLTTFAVLFSLCTVMLISNHTKVRAGAGNMRPMTGETSGKKIDVQLLPRLRQTHRGSGETTRVIFNVTGSSSTAHASSVLQRMGARVKKELGALNIIVADVPVDTLETMAQQPEVSWVSADQQVASLASTDNTSHVEVTTGTSKILPQDTNGQLGSGVANGGAGNGVGIAVLDSGVTPS